MSTLQSSQPDKDIDPNRTSGENDTKPTPKVSPPAGEQPMPLPGFDDGDEDEFEADVRTAQADPANLEQRLQRYRTPNRADYLNDQAQDFKASPAEADLSTFTPDPLDAESTPEEEDSRWKTAWSILREVGETIILTLIIFFLIQTVVRNFRVVGTSMVNNLHNGQYLIIDKVSYNPLLMEYLDIGGPQRGDVVVFKPPGNPNEDYVKRIIGLEGEEINVVNGQVFVNGEALEEPFEPVQGTYTMPNPVVVPEGQIFVLGDNRNNSNDSHNWGPLPIENVVGRAWVSYWPPDQWGMIPRDIPTDEATLKHFVGQFIPNASANSE